MIKLFIVLLATLGLVTTVLGTTTQTAFAQVPPLESTNPPATNESDKSEVTTTPISIGKTTIPVSSGEQIIIDIPLKDGNTYKLVPIK